MATKKKAAKSRSRGGGRKTRRVLVVDDHPIVRKGLAQLVAQERDLVICGEASDANEALEVIPEAAPDIVLVDISLEGTNGLELTKAVHHHNPDLPILVLSMHDEVLYAERALRAGAKGYLMKHEAPATLLQAVRKILDGGISVSDRVAAIMIEDFVSGGGKEPRRVGVEKLSDRELEVFELIGRGQSTRDIARDLKLSVKTVETHRAHIKGKLKFKNSTEMMRHAVHWVETSINSQ
jgi:DNA-binding NarL/FixJ family response regulator